MLVPLEVGHFEIGLESFTKFKVLGNKSIRFDSKLWYQINREFTVIKINKKYH